MEILQNWLIFIAHIIAAIAIIVIIIKSFKYIRAFFKRSSLMRRLRAICKNKGYILKENNVYRSVIKSNTAPELCIKANDKLYLVKFFTCLKYRDTYTLTDHSSYFTSSNTANIMAVIERSPLGTMPLHGRNEQRLWNKTTVKTGEHHIKKEIKNDSVSFKQGENIERILCINPISVDMQVVHTNRPEKVFDGERFKDCIVYSGSAMCEFFNAL